MIKLVNTSTVPNRILLKRPSADEIKGLHDFAIVSIYAGDMQ